MIADHKTAFFAAAAIALINKDIDLQVAATDWAEKAKKHFDLYDEMEAKLVQERLPDEASYRREASVGKLYHKKLIELPQKRRQFEALLKVSGRSDKTAGHQSGVSTEITEYLDAYHEMAMELVSERIRQCFEVPKLSEGATDGIEAATYYEELYRKKLIELPQQRQQFAALYTMFR